MPSTGFRQRELSHGMCAYITLLVSMLHRAHATQHGPVPVCRAAERQIESWEMQFNNFSLDSYCALVLLEALRRQHPPEYGTNRPIPEKEGLLKKLWKALRKRFAKPAAPQAYENVQKLSEYPCHFERGAEAICEGAEPSAEEGAEVPRRKAG